MHPWHDLPAYQNDLLNVVVEISAGSKTKYELDKEYGLLRLDRVLAGSQVYPVNYGMIPGTMGPDGDPLDALVICQQPIHPGTLARVRILAVMHMTDQGETDDKILGIAHPDPAYLHLTRLEEIPATFRGELDQFFEIYTRLENKYVNVSGFSGEPEARACIEEARQRYSVRYPKPPIPGAGM